MPKEKEPKQVEVESPGISFREQINLGSKSQYASYFQATDYKGVGRRDEKIDFINSFQGEIDQTLEIIHIPLRKCPWPMPGAPEEPGDNLWDDIHKFIYEYIDLADDRLYDVLTAWIFSSWITEAWTVVPYIQILGPKNSGKTRLLEVLHALCYRGIMSSNISEPALFRSVEAWKPTLLLDETEIYNNESRSAVQNLLNSGYRRGQYAIRVRNVEKGQPVLDLFDVFGLKALSGTAGLRDTLESRCIVIKMEKNIRKVKFKIDEEYSKKLRSRLLLWRFRELSEISEVNEALQKEVEALQKYKDGRFVELFSCLATVANHGKANILSYASDAYQIKMDEEETSIESEILYAIIKSHPNLEGGKLSTQSISDAFNEGRSEREAWNIRSVGRVVERLGLQKKRMTGGKSGWVWDNNRIKRLCERYAIPTPFLNASLTSLSSLSSPDEKTVEPEQKPNPTPQAQTSQEPQQKIVELPSSLGLAETKLVTTAQTVKVGDGYLREVSKEYLKDLLKWPQDYFDKIIALAIRDKMIWVSPDGMVHLT